MVCYEIVYACKYVIELIVIILGYVKAYSSFNSVFFNPLYMNFFLASK